MQKRRAYGFTLIELLIVMLIIAILAALLLPVFNRVRENARQSSCIANMKNIGTALANYETRHSAFPPGIISWNPNRGTVQAPGQNTQECRFSITTNDTCEDTSLGRFSMVSGLTLILDDMAEKSTYAAYNLDMACCSRSNATAVANIIKTYVCPSNPASPRDRLTAGQPGDFYLGAPPDTNRGTTGIRSVGPTDYALSMGGNAMVLASCQSPAVGGTGGVAKFPPAFRQAAGVFYLNSSVGNRAMRDGSSNTILAGEAAGGPDMRAGGPAFPAVNDPLTMIPTAPLTNPAGAFIDTPWSQGYISNDQGTGGFGCVLAASAFDAWYNLGGPIAEGNSIPTIGAGDLMPAYGVDPGFNAAVNSSRGSGGLAGGFTPLKVNMAKVKLNRPTCIVQNDTFSISGVVGAGTAKTEILSNVQISVAGFRSYHPELIIACYGDTHTGKISQQVDARTLVMLTTFAGRETMPATSTR